jgi:hypothetical protein
MELSNIMDQFSHKLGKTLGFKTLYEVFFKNKNSLTVGLHN